MQKQDDECAAVFNVHMGMHAHYPEASCSFLHSIMELASVPRASVVVLLLLLLLLGPWSCQQAGSSDEASDERRVLLEFKRGIVEDRSGVLGSWKSAQSICTWTGVGCTPAGGVASLRLPGKALKGTITPLLFSLPSLTHLNLSYNSFQGSFPNIQGGNGTSIRSLDLSSNFLSGSVPASIGNLVNLQVLDLTVNDFSGPLPVELGLCRSLVSLQLGVASDGISYNKINGTIPDALANCSSLTLLGLYYTELTGSIPAWLGSLQHLQELILEENLLTGSVPGSLGNLSSLTALVLISNLGLGGEIPGELGSCTRLNLLALGMDQHSPHYAQRQRCRISGKLPPSSFFRNLTSLEFVFIVGTEITGSIPAHLGSVKSLKGLYLRGNYLEGEIPSALGNLTNLEQLDLRQNDFKGFIPRELGSCTSLMVFAVGKSSDFEYAGNNINPGTINDDAEYLPNDLAGSIPEEIVQLPFLNTLYVGYTRIDGPFPSLKNSSLQLVALTHNQLTWPISDDSLLGCSSLQELDLYSNRLFGPIPKALGNLSDLTFLSMAYNDFSGIFPLELTFCRKLQTLWLGGSSFSDNGPRRSNITGGIPEELGYLDQLTELTLGSMQLSGRIPSTLGNCSRLQLLYLYNTNLSGSLPGEISNITGLSGINLSSNRLDGPLSKVDWSKLASLNGLQLSRNSFTGTIPESFGSTNIGSLIASGNQLSGSIPFSFRNCSNLTMLALDYNQLSGDIGYVLDILSYGGEMCALLLSSNKFTGSLPGWIGNRFQHLVMLFLDGNQLGGLIPTSLAYLPALQQPFQADPTNPKHTIIRQLHEDVEPLIFITVKNITQAFFAILRSTTMLDLSNNNFQGEIPPEMFSLLGLRYLNLSRNHLVGPIPSTLANLKSLIQLDVSKNGLVGPIPAAFVHLSGLDYLDVSNNDLAGEIPPGIATRYSIYSFLGNPSLCGNPLKVTCPKQSGGGNLIPKSSQGSLWFSWIAFAVGSATSFLLVLMLFLSTDRGLHYMFGDQEPPFYIRLHGLYIAPMMQKMEQEFALQGIAAEVAEEVAHTRIGGPAHPNSA